MDFDKAAKIVRGRGLALHQRPATKNSPAAPRAHCPAYRTPGSKGGRDRRVSSDWTEGREARPRAPRSTRAGFGRRRDPESALRPESDPPRFFSNACFGKNRSPCWAKNSVAPAFETSGNSAFSLASACVNSTVAAPVNSGVGAATTTSMIPKRPNAFSNAMSRLLQSSLSESRALTSEFRRKWLAV